MRFLLDENIPFLLIDLLKSLGHTIEHVRRTSLIGLPDEEIVEYSKNQKVLEFYLGLKAEVCSGLLDAQDCIHPHTEVCGFLHQQS